LGQTFHAAAEQLSIGQVVNVYGVLNKEGAVSEAVVQPTNAYGANGDPVFVKGVVTNADAILGRVEVDGMSIDYTSQLSKPGFTTPNIGDVIAIAASQPAQKGALVATATGSDAYGAGVSSGGSQFAGGISVVADSTSVGTTVAGMTGGGLHSSAMTGGGFESAGMTGGGLHSSGMTGGGLHSSAMTGGGFESAGMTGGGLHSSGMTGGGLHSSAMTGGGFESAGMTGGGLHSSGMTGGGVRAAGMTGGGR